MQADIKTWIQKIDNSVVRDNILDACTAEMTKQISRGNFSDKANAEAINAFREMGENYAPSILTENSTRNIFLLDDENLGITIGEYAIQGVRQAQVGNTDKIAGVMAIAFALIGIKLLQYGLLGIIGGGVFLLTAALSASIAWKIFQSRSDFAVMPGLLQEIAFQHVARAKKCLVKGLIRFNGYPEASLNFKNKVLETFELIGDPQRAERIVKQHEKGLYEATTGQSFVE